MMDLATVFFVEEWGERAVKPDHDECRDERHRGASAPHGCVGAAMGVGVRRWPHAGMRRRAQEEHG